MHECYGCGHDVEDHEHLAHTCQVEGCDCLTFEQLPDDDDEYGR